jgi:hypothetical protein
VSGFYRQCGILNISEPYRPPYPFTEIALLALLLLLLLLLLWKMLLVPEAAWCPETPLLRAQKQMKIKGAVPVAECTLLRAGSAMHSGNYHTQR